VNAVRELVPTFDELGRRLHDDTPAGSDAQLSLSVEELAIQAAALEGGVSHYTLVVVDSDELGSEARKRKDKIKSSRAHPKVIYKRNKLLAKELERAAQASGSGVHISVLLVDVRTGQGMRNLWRHLWDCVSQPLALDSTSDGDARPTHGEEARIGD